MITLWVDNCSTQNKNWTLFTTLCQLVNDSTNKCEMITLKYFEPGHTFMAADAFHKRVEDEMRKMKNVFDFEDFKNCIAAQGIAIEMLADDFYDYKSKLSKAKDTHYPYLDDVVVVQFRRGSTGMFWKTDMQLVEFKYGDFLQKKFIKIWQAKNVFQRKPGPRGIPLKKKI